MAMNFAPGVFADQLSELAGYKAGLALSIEELCDHLSGDDRNLGDLVVQSEQHGIRIRSEEFEAVCYRLYYRIGYTEDEYDGCPSGIRLYHKYKSNPKMLALYESVAKICNDMLTQMIVVDPKTIPKSGLDPTPIMIRCRQEHGLQGMEMALEYLMGFNQQMRMSPHALHRFSEWHDPLELKALFTGTSKAPEKGKFIDQRYVDYLSNNMERISAMHWRKFEELTAEFFNESGFRVEIGPGSDDDGVDVRLWKADAKQDEKPTCLVQCKRQKDKIEKIVIKGLAADVQFMGADYGMIVTTSELSPGAKTTISSRGYPIEVVERDAVKGWLTRLRTPGTGIVRNRPL